MCNFQKDLEDSKARQDCCDERDMKALGMVGRYRHIFMGGHMARTNDEIRLHARAHHARTSAFN